MKVSSNLEVVNDDGYLNFYSKVAKLDSTLKTLRKVNETAGKCYLNIIMI